RRTGIRSDCGTNCKARSHLLLPAKPQPLLVCRTLARKISLSVREQKKWCVCRKLLFGLTFLVAAMVAEAQAPKASPAKVPRAHPRKAITRHDDSVTSKPAPDLALRPQGAHKADALARFVEGMAF